MTWFASLITGCRSRSPGHAKDIYTESLNPGGLLRRKLRAARFAVTCTEANRRHLERDRAGRRAVHRVYHGLNADFARILAERRAAARPRNGRLRVLGVGRLVPKKGFDVLVEAFADARRPRRRRSRRVIVGEERREHGSDRAAPPDRRARPRRPRPAAGPMGQAELLDEYRRASAFCLPCRVLDDGDRDGIPNVLVEAMACGVPS